MLQLLPCPHCGQQSLLPHDTSLEATLKCPSCHEVLVLGEALLQQFSSWEVVEDPAAVVSPELPGNASQLSQPIVVPVPAAGSPQEELQLVDAPGATALAPTPKVSVRPYTHFEYERMRRKQKSPFWSMVPVVLGGLAAFPIALLILWYVLGRDVGEMGPTVAEYAPWIVPKQFHPVSKRTLGNQSSPPRRQSPKPGESGLPQLREFESKPTPAPSLPAGVEMMEPEVGQPIDQVADAVPSTSASKTEESSGMSSNDSSENASASKLATETSGQTPAVAEESIRPATQVVTASDDSAPNQNLFASIREAKDLLVQLEKAMETASADRLDLLKSAYDRLSQLAVMFSGIDKDNAVQRTVRDQMQPIAREIKQNTELQTVLDKYLERTAGQASVATPAGIAMTLEVTNVEQLPEYWMVAGNHKLAANTIIEVPRSLAPVLAADQRLFVLGVLAPGEAGDADAPATLRVCYLHSL